MTVQSVKGNVHLEFWVRFAADASLEKVATCWSCQTNSANNRDCLLKSDVLGRKGQMQ